MNYRDRLIAILETLSSGKELLEYERSVPVAYIPTEVACQFLDDWFHPKCQNFINSFSEGELKDIAILCGYIDLARQIVEENRSQTIKEVLNIREWRMMMGKASELLDRIRKS